MSLQQSEQSPQPRPGTIEIASASSSGIGFNAFLPVGEVPDRRFDRSQQIGTPVSRLMAPRNFAAD
jgi:hypothetical protein